MKGHRFNDEAALISYSEMFRFHSDIFQGTIITPQIRQIVIVKFIFLCKRKWRVVFHNFRIMLSKWNVLTANDYFVILCRYFLL